MARVSITPVTPLGAYGNYVADAANTPYTATTGLSGDDGDQFTMSGNDLVLVKNVGVGDQTIQFDSVDDPFGRAGNIGPYTLSSGEDATFGPFQVQGWRQTDNNLYFESNSSDIEVLVIAL